MNNNSKPIFVWQYLNEYESEKEKVLAAINKVLESGQLILGKSVVSFEKEFASYCSAKYGIGVDNGTNAIALGLRALGIKSGDEVITVSITAVPTVSAIASTGAVARFVDIDPSTYLMNTNALKEVISKKTRCILPVHLFGQCVDMIKIQDIADKYGLKILEDCAQAHGATNHGQKAGSMSEAAAFSFYPTKLLGGFGDGGMVITSDKRIDSKLRRLRFYGMEGNYYAEEQGYNSRLDELHAEILRYKLTQLDKYIRRRREIAANYENLLKETDLKLPYTTENNEHAYYLYVVRHKKRDKILKELKAKNIFLNISYPWPIHIMKGYSNLGYKSGDLPNTEKVAKEIFSLPMYPTLSKVEQETVCDSLKIILNSL